MTLDFCRQFRTWGVFIVLIAAPASTLADPLEGLSPHQRSLLSHQYLELTQHLDNMRDRFEKIGKENAKFRYRITLMRDNLLNTVKQLSSGPQYGHAMANIGHDPRPGSPIISNSGIVGEYVGYDPVMKRHIFLSDSGVIETPNKPTMIKAGETIKGLKVISVSRASPQSEAKIKFESGTPGSPAQATEIAASDFGKLERERLAGQPAEGRASSEPGAERGKPAARGGVWQKILRAGRL